MVVRHCRPFYTQIPLTGRSTDTHISDKYGVSNACCGLAQRDGPHEQQWSYQQYPSYGYAPSPFGPPYHTAPPPPKASYGPPHPSSYAPPLPNAHPYAGYGAAAVTPCSRTQSSSSGSPSGSSRDFARLRSHRLGATKVEGGGGRSRVWSPNSAALPQSAAATTNPVAAQRSAQPVAASPEPLHQVCDVFWVLHYFTRKSCMETFASDPPVPM